MATPTAEQIQWAQGLAAAGVDTLKKLAGDANTPPDVRLQAAIALLETAGKVLAGAP